MKKILVFVFYEIIYDAIVYMPTYFGKKMRLFLFKLLTEKIGKNPNFGFGSKILNGRNMRLGNNCHLGDFSHIIGGGVK